MVGIYGSSDLLHEAVKFWAEGTIGVNLGNLDRAIKSVMAHEKPDQNWGFSRAADLMAGMMPEDCLRFPR